MSTKQLYWTTSKASDGYRVHASYRNGNKAFVSCEAYSTRRKAVANARDFGAPAELMQVPNGIAVLSTVTRNG